MYDPPKGAELRAIQTLRRCAEKLERLHFEQPWTAGMSVATRHALEGVRVNGWERLFNGLAALGEIRTFVGAAKRAYKVAKRAERIALQELERAEKAMRKFKICPECKGACGVYDPPLQKYATDWHPCAYCDARGLVRA